MNSLTRRALSLGALILAGGLAACAPAATPAVTTQAPVVAPAPVAPAQEVTGRVTRLNAQTRVMTVANHTGTVAANVDLSGIRAGTRVVAQYVPATVTRLAPATGRQGARFAGYNARTHVVSVNAGRAHHAAVAVGATQEVAAGLRRGQHVEFESAPASFAAVAAAPAPAAPARRHAAH